MVIASQYSFLLFLLLLLSKSLATFLPIDLYPHEKHHHAPPRTKSPDSAGALENVADALASMQDLYFEHYQGTWPSAIDWTAAFIQTIATAGLSTISQALSSSEADSDVSRTAKENLVDMFFDQIVGSYFGQDAVGIRGQAFDDMLWVVLGWLEAVQFVDKHSELHYPLSAQKQDLKAGGIGAILANVSWHGNGWIPTFAHRSRVFWDLASKGWDTRLCGGGMNWNPRLIPYKNAITNELWISASIKMYLYFPGDNIRSPFRAGSTTTSGNCPVKSHDGNKNLPPCPPRDPKFLEAAILGYKWLMNSNMTNNIGLFVDGFHVRDLGRGGTKCNARNEDVYTYNQGVLLTGQRGLYEATGASSYLEEGHALVQNVIAATGWNLQLGTPFGEIDKNGSGLLPPWHGLGRAGVLEERCDALAYCSQNGQTFKGIFMHHLTTFCAPLLGDSPVVPGVRYDDAVIHAHRAQCLLYAPWVKHNAQAALGTRNADGKFGMWWTVGLLGWDDEKDVKFKLPPWEMTPEHGAVDYRSNGLPDDGVWQPQGVPPLWTPEEGNVDAVRLPSWLWDYVPDEESDEARNGFDANDGQKVISRSEHPNDPNDRGRGRTVETQAGGLSVLRAAFEFGRLEDAAAAASAGTKPLEL